MSIASNVVVGRYVASIMDGPDEDDEPDEVPARGIIEFTASVPYLVSTPGSPHSKAVLLTKMIGILNENGDVCAPDPADRSKPGKLLRLIATNAPGYTPSGWTWTASPKFEDVDGNRMQGVMDSFSFAVPAEGPPVDLITVARVPASKGTGAEQALALLALAKDEAERARAAADEVVARADRGEFIGPEGPASTAPSTVPGPPGPSAYQVAVAGGYTGTSTQWLASLKGTKGEAGPSAYDVAVAGGYSGTPAAWLASLKGEKGADSTVPGPPGKDSTVPGPPGKDSTVPGPPGKDSTVPGPPGPPGPATKNHIFAVRYTSGAWEYASLTAAKAGGLLDEQTIWFIGSPTGTAPSWARTGDVVTTP